jgi:serine/threonine-protein kinase
MSEGAMGRRYTLLLRLEEGAFAEHYKARADGPGPAEVVVKLIAPKASDPAYGRALHENGVRTRSLRESGALGFDEVGLLKGQLAAVRPFVEGYNLGDALRRLSTKEVVLPPALALYIVAEAAQIVGAAHRAGWLHGAITPGNVLLGADGKVRVVDFGALEAMNACESLRALAQRGRNAYRAPELKAGGGGTGAADVYSLAAIAYELLTLHEVAASRGGALSTKRDVLTAPSRLDRRVNARVDPVIMRGLESAATRRYKTAGELSDAVRSLFSVLGYAPSATEAARFVKEIFPNEVSMAGGPVPFSEPFALQPLEGASNTCELPALPDERSPFTSPSIDVPKGAPFSTEPESRVPSTGGAPITREAPVEETTGEKAVDDWVAPPGQMSKAPRLTGRGRRGEAPGEGDGVSPAAARRIREVEDARPESPADTLNEGAPLEGDGAGEEPEEEGPGTLHDWHEPPRPPPEKPKAPRVGLPAWILAFVVCAAVAVFFYVAVGHKLARGGAHDIDVVGERDPNALNPTPLPRPDAVPQVPDKPPEKPPEPKGPPVLTITSDREALVFIDGQEIKRSTPLTLRTLGPGAHTISLESGGQMREKHVVLKQGEEEKVFIGFAAKKGGGKPDKGTKR